MVYDIWWCGQRRPDGIVTVAGSGLAVVVEEEEEGRKKDCCCCWWFVEKR
jgi:hypothetical protein